jgi:hypothetical protein
VGEGNTEMKGEKSKRTKCVRAYCVNVLQLRGRMNVMCVRLIALLLVAVCISDYEARNA